MQHPDPSRPRPGDVLDGYRLLRKLGEGRRAEVFLGLADGEPHAALKAYRSSCSAADRSAELEALTRAAHAHVVHVRDVASNSLILERLELGSLAHLLSIRSALSAGEAVTILAPLGSALDAMHNSGVTHGAIGPMNVHFRATGAPVICGFGAARLHEPGLTPAARAALPDVTVDRAAFARLATRILALVTDDRTAHTVSWLDHQAHEEFPDDIGEELGERLFDIADAQPVRFEPDDLPRAPIVPARVLPDRRSPGRVSLGPASPGAESPGPGSRGPVSPGTASPPAGPAAIARRSGMPDWVGEVVGESLDGSPVAALKARLLPHLRGVRRPVWVVAGAVAVALVVALMVVPPSDGRDMTPGVTEVAPSESPVVLEDSALTADDPVEAVVALLELRERCIRDLSVLCLDGVDQAGSTAMADDVALVRSLQTDAVQQETDDLTSVATGELVERLGDSALVRLSPASGSGDGSTDEETQPASLLLMKGEAGWRIRSYLKG
jgi:eukaryotic-like serine/threonine-protein kinase